MNDKLHSDVAIGAIQKMLTYSDILSLWEITFLKSLMKKRPSTGLNCSGLYKFIRVTNRQFQILVEIQFKVIQNDHYKEVIHGKVDEL